jgi:cell division protein FtsQ
MEVFHGLSEATDLQGLQITRLSENELGEWALTFDQGITLKLGARDMQERLQRFLSVYRARLVERFDEVQQVDARYANGVAVSWQVNEPQQSPALLAAAKGPTSRHGVLALPQEQF